MWRGVVLCTIMTKGDKTMLVSFVIPLALTLNLSPPREPSTLADYHQNAAPPPRIVRLLALFLVLAFQVTVISTVRL